MQRCSKHIFAAVNKHATIEAVFSVGAALRLYNKELRQLELELSRVPELAVAAEDSGVGHWQNSGKKELGCGKKT
jgi:hypothetical protein